MSEYIISQSKQQISLSIVLQGLGMQDKFDFHGLLVPGSSLDIMVDDSKKLRLLGGQGGTHRTWGVCSIKLNLEYTVLT